MGEPAVDQSTQPNSGRPGGVPAQKPASGYVEEGPFPRLQERTQTQLGFVNNLLVTLAVGLLAFAVNASASSAELHRLGWRRWLLLIGLLAMACSVLAGLRLAFNRLASPRITTRVASLPQLRVRSQTEIPPSDLPLALPRAFSPT